MIYLIAIVAKQYIIQHKCLKKWIGSVGTCEASRFDSNSNRPFRFDLKVMGRFENFRIGRACPLLVVVKRLKPLMALSGTAYRLASSMSDHTPVLFNVFEEWTVKSVVLHISFVSFVINYRLLNAIFDSYSVGPSWNMLASSTLGEYSRHRRFQAHRL